MSRLALSEVGLALSRVELTLSGVELALSGVEESKDYSSLLPSFSASLSGPPKL